MAAFNFPNSPSTNDLHTENGVTYKWNGTVWKRQNASYTDATNLNVTGIATFAGNIDANGDLDVDGHTNLDNVSVAGVTTMSSTLNVSGVTNLSAELRANANIRMTNAGPKITFIDDNHNPDYEVGNSDGVLRIRDITSSVNRLAVSSTGNISISNDLDVDGHTNLDNVSVAGVSTFTGNVIASARLGLGQATPVSKLHISESGSNTINIQLTNATTGHTYGSDGMTIGYSSNSSVGFINVAESSSGFTIKTGGTASGNERLRIDSSGTVRVGNNSSFTAHTAADDLVVGSTSGSNGMTILTGVATGSIFFNHGSGNEGVIQYIHTGTEHMRIKSEGYIKLDAGGNNHGGGVYSLEKTCTTSGTNVFKFELTHGALAGTLYAIGSNSGNSVSKVYAFAGHFSSNDLQKIADSGAYSGYNFSVSCSTSNSTHTFTVTTTGENVEVALTMHLGSPNQNVTYTEL